VLALPDFDLFLSFFFLSFLCFFYDLDFLFLFSDFLLCNLSDLSTIGFYATSTTGVFGFG